MNRPRVTAQHSVEPTDRVAWSGPFVHTTPDVEVSVSFDLHDHASALDLLDAAGDLLQHQVDNRLTGAARAIVAARREAIIDRAAWSTVPNVPVLFWSFRIMAGIGFAMIALFATAFVLCSMRRFDQRWFLRLCVLAIPLPWIAVMVGNGQGEKRDPRQKNVYKPATARAAAHEHSTHTLTTCAPLRRHHRRYPKHRRPSTNVAGLTYNVFKVILS